MADVIGLSDGLVKSSRCRIMKVEEAPTTSLVQPELRAKARVIS